MLTVNLNFTNMYIKMPSNLVFLDVQLYSFYKMASWLLQGNLLQIAN